MKKEKTELLQVLQNQSIGAYGDCDEIVTELRGIANNFMPDAIARTTRICKSMMFAFMYGAMMGIRHERKRRRTDNGNIYKNRIKEIIDIIQREDVLEYLYVFIKLKTEDVIKGEVVNE